MTYNNLSSVTRANWITNILKETPKLSLMNIDFIMITNAFHEFFIDELASNNHQSHHYSDGETVISFLYDTNRCKTLDATYRKLTHT